MPAPGDRDIRANPRTNLYLAAVLEGPGFSTPVRVRNMSSSGALVEAAEVPAIGAAVRLMRGSLSASAEVAWSAQGQCGLRFSSLVSVREWLAPPSNREQQRINDAIRVLKAGAIPLPPTTGTSDVEGASHLRGDLHNIGRLLEKVADDLASNDATVLAHAKHLQNLDIAIQTVNALRASIGSDVAGPADSRLDNLRVSCREALEGR